MPQNPAPEGSSQRRPLASRSWKIMGKVADALIRAKISPNAISVSSMVFAALAGSAFYATAVFPDSARWLWLLAAAGIQLRLLANLFDGMVAVGSGTQSVLGEIYNEVPDRVSDLFILLGAGYAAGSSPELGYLSALAAFFVAYVRVVGANLGTGQFFLGPQAKPHRMFVVTMASLYAAAAPDAWQTWGSFAGQRYGVMAAALALIVVGGPLTAWRRLRRIATALEEKGI